MEKVNIMKEKWDYLIILDACRYDYFEQVWKNYLQGNLEKKISIGTSTRQWRNKSFTDFYDDVVYISANPYINSVAQVKGFSGMDHFPKIYDLWLEDWDDEQGTVMPQVVNTKSIDIIKSNPGKRFIIHYIQPHEPYIGSSVTGPGFDVPLAGGHLEGVNQGRLKSRIIKKLMKLLSGVLYWTGIRGNFLIWHIREFFKMPPAGPMDAVRRKYGDQVLRDAYKENLEIVLEYVKQLVEKLDGRIIITADHGEMLGEDNRYCHWSRATEKELSEIPWLIIDKGQRTQLSDQQIEQETQKHEDANAPDEKTKEALQERLKKLGY
ncbi:MAG: sulfatase-like hydrolase/transferase [Planctomycetota bacterium]